MVEVIPENSKFDINAAQPADLFNLLANLGVDPARAQDIAAGIVDWRAQPPGGASAFDDFYASLRPPYIAPHARFQEIEELLSVRGVTPDLFYGKWQTAPDGSAQHLALRTGLADCVSVFGGTRQFDVNAAPPAVLATVGVPPEGIAALVDRRRTQPFSCRATWLPSQQSPALVSHACAWADSLLSRFARRRVCAWRMANFRTCIALLVRW